jgi:hypothetical protein
VCLRLALRLPVVEGIGSSVESKKEGDIELDLPKVAPGDEVGKE